MPFLAKKKKTILNSESSYIFNITRTLNHLLAQKNHTAKVLISYQNREDQDKMLEDKRLFKFSTIQTCKYGSLVRLHAGVKYLEQEGLEQDNVLY